MLTLECLAVLCVIASNICRDVLLKVGGNKVDPSFLLNLTGAIICWTIAIGLYIKKWIKRKRRADASSVLLLSEKNESNQDNHPMILTSGQEDIVAEEDLMDEESSDSIQNVSDTGSGNDERDIPSTPSIRMVASLTVLGALDELSYFPALLVGKVFSPMELCLGTFFATVLILVIVLAFLSKFKPLVDFLDRIPLYGIVGIFAILLTVGLFF